MGKVGKVMLFPAVQKCVHSTCSMKQRYYWSPKNSLNNCIKGEAMLYTTLVY